MRGRPPVRRRPEAPAGPVPVTGSAVPPRARTRCPRPGRCRPPWTPPPSGLVGGPARSVGHPGHRPGLRCARHPGGGREAALAAIEAAGSRPGPVARDRGPDAVLCHHARRPGRRGRVVVVPAWTASRRTSPPGGGPALALPGQLRAGPAVAGTGRTARAQLAGSVTRRTIRCPMRLGCWRSWLTCARRSVVTYRRRGDPYPESFGGMFARASAVTPGGVNSPVRAFGSVGGTPRFIASGDRAVPDRRGRAPSTSTWSAPGAR